MLRNTIITTIAHGGVIPSRVAAYPSPDTGASIAS
jgi:hypothetical protein